MRNSTRLAQGLEIVELPVLRSLGAQLDEIDARVVREVYDGFYASRLKIVCSMWEKGKEIVGFRGANPTATWVRISKETGRTREDLKRWSDLYQQYPDFAVFLEEYAKPKAEAWTRNALAPAQEKLLEHKRLPELIEVPGDGGREPISRHVIRRHQPTVADVAGGTEASADPIDRICKRLEEHNRTEI